MNLNTSIRFPRGVLVLQWPSWSWSHSRWIYNYLCNQYKSPLTLWVRTPFRRGYSIQHYVINFVSDLRLVGGFLRLLLFPPPIKLTAPRYSWNIVESGVKHHKPHIIQTLCKLLQVCSLSSSDFTVVVVLNILLFLHMHNSILYNYWLLMRSTHDYTDLVNDWLTEANGRG